MPYAPFVIVTATTEIIRGVPRVRVNEAYTNALASFGLVPVVLPPMSAAVASAALTDVAGLVLTGGEDIDPRYFGETPHPKTGEPHHARDSYELALARRAYELRVPTLAICRGVQVMNVALGGSLVQDIPSQRETTIDHDPEGKRAERVHGVEIESDSRLAAIVGATTIAVNSSHHQALAQVAPPLLTTARSTDGVIEAVEANDPAWWMIGVQWHPEELMATPEVWDRRLFDAFAEEVRETSRD
ncbi:MAG TPA: gamma-glutamyl-gamma-aminobutyrate hydrolase family protein [Gemmatimonadaceae bacterium]|nr:gamma-glutamyl-gamma-aminobutyrate hydrolase family protein [Gemmatimonadaceae bacterium]